MSEGKANLAFVLNSLLDIFLHYIVLDLTIHDPLHPEHTRIDGIFYSMLNKTPHSFAFLLIALLLDCHYPFVLLFGLGVDKAVTEVDFTETFGLFSQVCFEDASKL